MSNSKGKALLYDAVADAFRERQTVLHSFATFAQLALIKGGTLRAPEGEHDDRADSYALACLACQLPQYEAYTGPLCYSTPWPPDQDPAAHTTSSLPLLLEDLRIDLEGDWDPGLAAWR